MKKEFVTPVIEVVWKYKILYVLIILFCITCAIFYSLSQPKKYIAKYSFVVDESSGNNPGIGGIIGQLGLGSLNPTGFNLERVIEYAKSRYVIKNVLEDSILSDTEHPMIGNYLIDYFDLKEKWAENENNMFNSFVGFNDDINDSDKIQSIVLQNLYSFLVNGAKDKTLEYTISRNVATGIFNIYISTEDEILSYNLAHSVFTSLRDVYTKEALEKEIEMSRRIEGKLDSINTELVITENAYLNYKDRQSNILLERYKNKKSTFERQIFLLTSLQSDISRSLEATRFKILTLTPIFKSIDAPIYPLPSSKTSLIKSMIIAAIGCISLFLIHILIILALKNYNEGKQ